MSTQRLTRQLSAQSDSRRNGDTSRNTNAPEQNSAIRGQGVDTVFDPSAPELQSSWYSFAENIFCVNAYPNGITFSSHVNAHAVECESEEDEREKFIPSQFHLRFRDTRDYQLPSGKYFLHRDGFDKALEGHLSALHKKGTLKSSVFYLGSVSDPFSALPKKFDVTMACLELLEHYRPGMVVVQTRSPMMISALPFLKMFDDDIVVAVPIESHLESSIARYTPGQPKIADRLVAVDGLRAQGISVNLMASPVLPYGDFHRDAWEFAELLRDHGDYISLGSLASGRAADEIHLKALPVARRLEADRAYRWLRPHSYSQLYLALNSICPEKLMLPVEGPKAPSQLNMFAA